MVQVTIRMGSNQMKFNLPFNSNLSLNCFELIEMVLKKLNFKHKNLSQLSKTYLLYYRLNSSEKLLNQSENVLKILKFFNQSSYFIIRKKVLINTKIQGPRSFHLYESIASKSDTQELVYIQKTKEMFLKEIFTNEIVINNQFEQIKIMDKIRT